MGAIMNAPTPSMSAELPSAGGSAPRFTGTKSRMAGLLVKGSLLQLVTLGLYRFWYLTDIRRHLWGNTEVAGDGLEYTGTGRELFVGFLIALAIIVPLNVALFLGALATGLVGPALSVVAFVILAVLGQYALFRGRRYRLTRTIWRGLRFHQTGSGWNYALRASLWSIANLVTVGLAYPFSIASLERYKMRHTWYGDARASFAGTGGSFFKRAGLIWLVVMAPFAATLVFLFASTDIVALMADLEAYDPETSEAGAGQLMALIAPGIGLAWALFAGMVLAPLFRAIEFRWWANGVRFSGVAVRSDLRNRSVYAIWFTYIAAFIAMSIVLTLVAGMAGAIYALAGGGAATLGALADPAVWSEGVITVASIVFYLLLMVLMGVIYQLVVVRGFWKLEWETLRLSGLDALYAAQARGEQSSAIGEGLADALDIGAF